MRFGGNIFLNNPRNPKLENSAVSSRTAKSVSSTKTANLKKKRNPKKINSRSVVDRLHMYSSKKPVNLIFKKDLFSRKRKQRKPFFSMPTNLKSQKQRNFRGG